MLLTFSSASATLRQRFTLKERDIETELDYFLARYYSGKPLIPQSWNRYTYCINSPLILVDPSGLDWGYYDLGNGKTSIVWFEGKVGKYEGRQYTAFTPAKDGTVIPLAEGGSARIYQNGARTYIPGAPKITISGQERLNAAAGMVDGTIPFGRQIREAALGGPGGVDTDSAEYNNASAISEGVSAGTLLINWGRIRVVVNAGADNAYSRVVEVEAWEAAPVNYALAANGGTATGSSTLSPYVAGHVIDGSRRGINGTSWLDNTNAGFPDWIEVSFNGSKTISEIDVVTQQDDPQNPIEPTLTQTFSLYGITAFEVQYWNGSNWVTVPGGSVSGNNKVWRQFTFSPITTTKIRVVVNAGADNTYSRVMEVEAWNTPSVPSSININWLVADQLGTPRMIFDKTGSLATTKRHDYLPFGEELFAGVGGRTTTLGYTGDTLHQQFTSKERDIETGLDYFIARYYSTMQGRFTSVDPENAGANPDDAQSWN